MWVHEEVSPSAPRCHRLRDQPLSYPQDGRSPADQPHRWISAVVVVVVVVVAAAAAAADDDDDEDEDDD